MSTRIRKTISVTCDNCKKHYLKREDTMKNWNGSCRPCTNKKIGAKNRAQNHYRWVTRKACIECGKESFWIKEQERCQKCLIKFRFQIKENHPRWKPDRSQLAKRQERNDIAYKEWRKNVWTRDNFKCKIENDDCNGRIEAHHILSWKDYPELRYIINNGITLCHAHHPRKRAEENRLNPFFQELISIKS